MDSRKLALIAIGMSAIAIACAVVALALLS